MKRTLTLLLLLTLSYSLSAEGEHCSFSPQVDVISGDFITDYISATKVGKYRPKLKHFKDYFPKTVSIMGSTQGKCRDSKIELKVFLRRTSWDSHDHDHDHQRIHDIAHKRAHASSMKKQYLKNSFYAKSQKVTKGQFAVDKIPHEKFYSDIEGKFWYDQVHYQLTLRGKKGEVHDKKDLYLDSPSRD